LRHPAKGSITLKRRYAVPANFTEGAAAEILARPRLIVGISGASGAIYGARLLELLRPLPVETHLVISRTADVTLAVETDLKPAAVRARADVVHANNDMAAPISSGSFKTMGMVVAPCSIRSMAEIASGVTTTLLSRAADVVLKERRRLVLLVRETPLHTGHLRTMTALSEMGAVIAPPVPAFYAKPNTLDEMIDQTLGRVLDFFDLETGLVRRWGEPLIENGRPLRSKPRRRKV
jgi:4-hydroxy-3-polyprenylbenzoate decarboxylase